MHLAFSFVLFPLSLSLQKWQDHENMKYVLLCFLFVWGLSEIDQNNNSEKMAAESCVYVSGLTPPSLYLVCVCVCGKLVVN